MAVLVLAHETVKILQQTFDGIQRGVTERQ